MGSYEDDSSKGPKTTVRRAVWYVGIATNSVGAKISPHGLHGLQGLHCLDRPGDWGARDPRSEVGGRPDVTSPLVQSDHDHGDPKRRLSGCSPYI
jgi:hypothetical protein